ncbi:MAG: patatin-like phospholipase family protein [Acidimicrobiales bacterium]
MDDAAPDGHPAVTAFVLGGGGALGAAEVGMLRALTESCERPGLIVGSSVGALNGAFFAADPTTGGARRLEEVWSSLQSGDVFGSSLWGRASNVIRHGTYLHSNEALRALIERALPDVRIEDLPVRFECVAASIERAGAHWFDSGPLADAVLASCAVPGLLPAVEIDGEHFLDGGLVYSVPVGRAIRRGATRVFVLHVGRLERKLTAPRLPWEVALVSFEIARRHRFSEDMATAPPGVEVHVLPSGADAPPAVNLRYRRVGDLRRRIEAAYEASMRHLSVLENRA